MHRLDPQPLHLRPWRRRARPGEASAPRIGSRAKPPPGEARYVLLILTLAALVGVFLIVRPFLNAVILSLLLAALFHPIHQRIRAALGRHRNAAALLSVLIVAALVIIPVSLFVGALVNQGIETFQKAQHWLAAGNLEKALNGPGIQRLLAHPLLRKLQNFLASHQIVFDPAKFDLSQRLLELSRAVLHFGMTRIIPIMSQTGVILFNFFLMFFLMFYAFRDGELMLQQLLHLSPLARSQEEVLLDRIRGVTRAVVLGALVIAACQGLLAMIAFRIVGIPALFWGTMLGVGALIPVIGGALVWVPATLYLLVTGHPYSALFLAAWCMGVVGTVDNFLRPFLMHGTTGMSTVVLFLALIGGIRMFGPMGILYGPLIFGLAAVCLYIYELEHHDFLKRQDSR